MNLSRLDQLLNLLQDSPEDEFLLYAVAKEYEGLGQSPEALGRYRDLQEKYPKYVATYYHYAKLLEKEERYQKALQIYEQGMAVAREIGDQHALGELANAKQNLEFDLD